MTDTRKCGQKPAEITRDKYDRDLYPRIKNEVNRHAGMLANFGFVQQQSRSTLFEYETEFWRIYADLDSTKTIPIWEAGGVPGIYAYPKGEEKTPIRIAVNAY